MQEEPPSLRTEREGGQEFSWLLVRPSCILFVRKEGLFAEPFVCELRPLGLGKVCRKSPRASARGERAIRSSPGFLYDPRASFSLGRRGCLPSPSRASLGRWVSARLQEEPPSLRAEREGDQEFPWLFVRPSRFLFARKEGWNTPGYPRWARAVTFPVSFYRVSPSGGPCPIR